MVYSSLPAYLDPPNWQQQQAASEQPRVNENSHQLLHPAPQLPPPGPPHGGSGSIRPGSMAYQARLAMLPQPVAALKCPRCESTNTKFCYFNNYNLAQPRHFCKTCRRYWTQGGALRNVPVGGGCRRNKKNRSRTRPKSPAQRQVGNSGSARSSPPGTNCNSIDHEMIGNPLPPQIPPQLPFMGSLQNFTRYHGVGSSHTPNIGLNFSVHDQNINTKGQDHVVGFQIGSNSSGTGGRSVLQQNIPFLGGLLDSSTGLNYPLFQSDHQSAIHDGSSGGMNMESNSRVFQLPPIKIEENKGLNLTIPTSMDVSENNQLLWGGNSWTELTGLSSSSATNLL